MTLLNLSWFLKCIYMSMQPISVKFLLVIFLWNFPCFKWIFLILSLIFFTVFIFFLQLDLTLTLRPLLIFLLSLRNCSCLCYLYSTFLKNYSILNFLLPLFFTLTPNLFPLYSMTFFPHVYIDLVLPLNFVCDF